MQHRFSTRLVAMLQNKLYVFCCPFYRSFSYLVLRLTEKSPLVPLYPETNQRSNKTNRDLLPAFIGYTNFSLWRGRIMLGIFTLCRMALASARKPYRIEIVSTHKNGDFRAISVTERSCAAPISKVEPHISDMFCATLWCNANKYSHYSGSE